LNVVKLTAEQLEILEIDPKEILQYRKSALEIRENILKMIYKANSGHPGGSLSCSDIMVALYGKILKYNPDDPTWEDRDYFILSKGHAAPALYATLAHYGFFSADSLSTLRQFGQPLQGHPKKGNLPGIEISSGALGIGLSVGVGLGLSLKLDKRENYVYILLGDGECEEGSVWEAAMSAAHYHLDDLIAIVDRNGLQSDGSTEKIMGLEPFADKWEKFGWNVIEIDGTNLNQLFNALHTAKVLAGKPTVIIAYVVKGYGTSVMEHLKTSHGTPPTEEEFCQAIAHIEEERRILCEDEGEDANQ
jgi:transketolase